MLSAKCQAHGNSRIKVNCCPQTLSDNSGELVIAWNHDKNPRQNGGGWEGEIEDKNTIFGYKMLGTSVFEI